MAAKLIKVEPDAPLCLMARKKVANEATRTLCGKKATKNSKGFVAKDAAEAMSKINCADCKEEIRQQGLKKDQKREEWKTIELITTNSYSFRTKKGNVSDGMEAGPKHFVRFFTEPVEKDVVYSKNTLVENGTQSVCAIQEYHQHPENGICKNFLPINNNTHDSNMYAWTLSSLDPLGVSPSVNCFDRTKCGLHGYIREGQWQELSPATWIKSHQKYLDSPQASMAAKGK